MPVHGNTGGFNLPVCDPHTIQGNQTIISENNRISPGRFPGHITPLYLPVLNTFWT
jgi:hypothetical protein